MDGSVPMPALFPVFGGCVEAGSAAFFLLGCQPQGGGGIWILKGLTCLWLTTLLRGDMLDRQVQYLTGAQSNSSVPRTSSV
jgi:hypothetical protein